MNKNEQRKAWKKILLRSCLGDFNCMISPSNPYFDEYWKGPHCPFLPECRKEAIGRERKRS